jgi:hypothetical protein
MMCVLGCQRISFQRSGAALPFDCYDCAPERGNYLQGLAQLPFRLHRRQSRLIPQTVNGILSTQ